MVRQSSQSWTLHDCEGSGVSQVATSICHLCKRHYCTIGVQGTALLQCIMPHSSPHWQQLTRYLSTWYCSSTSLKCFLILALYCSLWATCVIRTAWGREKLSQTLPVFGDNIKLCNASPANWAPTVLMFIKKFCMKYKNPSIKLG